MADKQVLPEAPVSVNTKIKSPNGFEYQLTMRGDDFSELMTMIAEKETILLKKKWSPLPYANSYQKQQKPVDYVPDRTCPTDGARLVYTQKRDGTKYIKCENNKWDKTTNRSTGCPFVEWPNQQGGGY